MTGETKLYDCWSDEHKILDEDSIESTRADFAARDWVKKYWFSMGMPERVRVYVRDADGFEWRYDVAVSFELLTRAVEVPSEEPPR